MLRATNQPGARQSLHNSIARLKSNAAEILLKEEIQQVRDDETNEQQESGRGQDCEGCAPVSFVDTSLTTQEASILSSKIGVCRKCRQGKVTPAAKEAIEIDDSPSCYEKQVKEEVDRRRAEMVVLPKEQEKSSVTNKTKTKRSYRSANQKNKEATVQKALRINAYKRYKAALKEATLHWKASKDVGEKRRARVRTCRKAAEEESESSTESLREIVRSVNARWINEGTRSTVSRYVKNGKHRESPVKRGQPTKLCPELMNATRLHMKMHQVTLGDVKGHEVKAIIGAATYDKEDVSEVKPDYAWRRIRESFPEDCKPTCQRRTGDLCSQYTTWQQLNDWFDYTKS